MRRQALLTFGLTVALGSLAVVTPADQRDEYWEMQVHTEGRTQAFAVTSIDSITFRSVQIPAVCCVGYDCMIATENECIDAGGDFHPGWDNCVPNPCLPALQAACCDLDGSCFVSNEDDCRSSGGSWHPEWGHCAPNPCVTIPAGVFTMGDGESWCGVDEHEVTLTQDFYLRQREVTNGEYMTAAQWAYDNGFITVDESHIHDALDGSTEELLVLNSGYSEVQFDAYSETFYLRQSPDAQNAYPDGYDPSEHPVSGVTWYGAARYCDWLSLMADLPRAYDHDGDWACNGGDPYGASSYRLPTDAEWEYAAQFNDDRTYPWGQDEPDCGRANYADCVGWTSPVGSYPPAPAALGLSDMAGNLIEWCNDWLECELGTAPVTDPVGPSSGTDRVQRGGSWGGGENTLQCAVRRSYEPELDYYWFGFRVARTVAR